MRRLVLTVCSATLALAACSAGTAAPPPTSTSVAPTRTTGPAVPSSRSVAGSPSTAPSTSVAATSRPPRPSTTHPPASPSHASALGGPGSSAPLVVLNPGHNGGNAAAASTIAKPVYSGYGTHKACDTTGTETDAGYTEHAFNWSVSQSVAAILRAHGVRVEFTRPNDTGIGPCVDRRAAIGNHPDVAAVVSIHADGAPAGGHGFHVNQDSRRPEGASAAVAAESDRLGRDIHDALVGSSGLVPSTYIGKDGYYYRTDLAGLDLATRPATFLELGNMRNSGDAALLSSAAGRQRIAGAVATGILTYLGVH